MLPRYRQHVVRTSNLLPGNMLPSKYMLPGPGVNAALMLSQAGQFNHVFNLYLVGIHLCLYRPPDNRPTPELECDLFPSV